MMVQLCSNSKSALLRKNELKFNLTHLNDGNAALGIGRNHATVTSTDTSVHPDHRHIAMTRRHKFDI
eukprot:scaffold1690_cov192-Skeletonema_menzelii.AAC.3